MKEKNEKYSFWQWPFAFKFTIFTEILLLLGITGSLIGGFISINYIYFIFAAIFMLFSLFFLFVGLRFFMLKVEIDTEKIIVKGALGVLAKCKIAEIKEVYIKEFFREGTFFVIKDDRIVNNPYSYTKKDCYIRFIYNEETESLVKNFWRGSVQKISWKTDIK